MFRLLLYGLILVAMVWAWLIPESWKRDCDICGTYRASCSSFTVAKNSDVVQMVKHCGNAKNPNDALVRMTLSKTDSESFILRPSNEQPLPLKPGEAPLWVSVSKDTKSKSDAWNIDSVGGRGGLFEPTYKRESN